MSKEWSKDTGITLALACVIFTLLAQDQRFLYLAAALMLAAVLWPEILFPLGWAWFKASETAHLIVAPAIFSAIFFLVVTPLGALWRMAKARMRKKRTESMFIDRHHRFCADDLRFPY